MKVAFACLVTFPASWAFAPTTPHGDLSSRATTTQRRRDLPILSAASTSSAATDVARLRPEHLQALADNKYVVIPHFIPADMQDALRADVSQLRAADEFDAAGIGQDATNALNTGIRIAETCFLGPGRYPDVPSAARDDLYAVLDRVRRDLARHSERPLDSSLTELLYAYYPQGGFYRRHRDAIKGSASVLREYSLLLYLNKDWTDEDGGKLRLHFDGGGDEVPEGGQPDFMDVSPEGGTLVLFESDAIPHEVLDTQKERVAVIGWYNKPLSLSDVGDIGGQGGNPIQIAMLGVAAALVTIGVAQILSK